MFAMSRNRMWEDEGTMGMGGVFQHAGAKPVLMSLWSMSEVATTKLAERFLSYVKQGKKHG